MEKGLFCLWALLRQASGDMGARCIVGPNVKFQPKIRLKKIVKMTNDTYFEKFPPKN
jgi:hypothetical protein